MGERADEVVNLDPDAPGDGALIGDGTVPVGHSATGAYNTDTTRGASPLPDDALGDGTTDDEVAASRAQIEETRSQMSETLDAIQHKLSPGNMARQAKDSIRDATIGKAGEAVSNAGDTAKGFAQTVTDTVRQNPVPAALAAIGLGWLFMSGRKQASDTQYGYPSYGYGRGPYGYGRGYEYGPSYDYGYERQSSDSVSGSAVDRAQDMAGNVAGRAQAVADQAQDMAGQAVSQVQGTAGQMAGQVQETATQLGAQAQYQAQRAASGFDQMMQERPLAVAAGAVALGIAVGLSLPSTPQEDRLMGEARDSLLQQAQQAAQDTAQKVQTVAQEAVGAAKDEAQNQFSQ